MQTYPKVLIIEDEPPAARRLEKMLRKELPQMELLANIDSVKNAVEYLSNNNDCELIMMDIQLADGISFEIFTHCDIECPIIFTTAYDDYSLQAFKVNSIDYLLKPIDEEDLKRAIKKFEKQKVSGTSISNEAIEKLLQSVYQKTYKERFLIKSGQTLSMVLISEVAYFFSKDGYVQLVTTNGKKHLIEYSLDHLLDMLDPNQFFRINRKFILKVDSIEKIASYFNSRLKLSLFPRSNEEVIVSRERVNDFKKWLDR